MKNCECLNFCGDDPGIREGGVNACDSYKLHRSNQIKLNELMKTYRATSTTDLILLMADEINSLRSKIDL